jgi:hypothetical protein
MPSSASNQRLKIRPFTYHSRTPPPPKSVIFVPLLRPFAAIPPAPQTTVNNGQLFPSVPLGLASVVENNLADSALIHCARPSHSAFVIISSFD